MTQLEQREALSLYRHISSAFSACVRSYKRDHTYSCLLGTPSPPIPPELFKLCKAADDLTAAAGPDAMEITPPLVDAETARVLTHLEAVHPNLQVYDDLDQAVSREVAGRVIRSLIQSGHVERPLGIRKGFQLTAAGLSLAAQVRRK